ncbi:O-antigen ligase family protein [Brevundimonas staleyi]|uniref:O-antigen ligase family protein n=2 Tax=Brevundimonas staleyi TaxID=74326 RepID=A0ABW0FRX8_9CAUL
MNGLLALTVASLFTPFQFATGVATVRPFDALAAVLFMAALTHLNRMRSDRTAIELWILLPYFGWHALSAFTVSAQNGLRETIQIAVVLLFAISLLILKDRLNVRQVGRHLLIGLFAVMLFNAAYHIAIGHTGGWKTLGDAKLSMTFLPVVLGLFLVFRPGWRLGLILWLTTGAVILLSGERKALLVFGVLSALVYGRGRLVTMTAMLAFGAQALQLFALATSNAYLTRQIDTLFNPPTTDLPLEALARGGTVESLSNAQRIFSLRLSEDLFSQHPLFGIGTNVYVHYVQQMFPYAPAYLRLGIHGEFQRVTVENGLLGLGLYLAIFAVSFGRIAALIRRLPRPARRTYTLAALVLILPCLVSLSLEAAATRSFLVLIVLSFAPDLMRRAAEMQGLLTWRPRPVRTWRVPLDDSRSSVH